MWCALKRARLSFLVGGSEDLSTLATDTAGQLDVLGHDGHTLGVDGAQVGVLEQTDQVGLASLLKMGKLLDVSWRKSGEIKKRITIRKNAFVWW